MSDYVDRNMQDQPFEEGVPLVDWARLEDDALNRPWLVFGGNDWTRQGEPSNQAAQLQPGDRQTQKTIVSKATFVPSNQIHGHRERMSVHDTYLIDARGPSVKWAHTGQLHTPLESSDFIATPLFEEVLIPSTASSVGEPSRFVCSHEHCDGVSFKRRSELNRHQRKHGQQLLYPCPAEGCGRIGRRSFTRQDKLRDHVIAGHDENSLFRCPEGFCQENRLTKDMLSIHTASAWRFCLLAGNHKPTFKYFGQYRTCPIPKCPFRLTIDLYSDRKDMDSLPRHLLTHSAKGRANFAQLILQRGYDASTGEVICPICSRENRFQGHLEFSNHFLTLHCVNAKGFLIKPGHQWDKFYEARAIFLASASVAGNVYAHRRTLLSLWPAIRDYPVWDDIKCLGPATRFLVRFRTSNNKSAIPVSTCFDPEVLRTWHKRQDALLLAETTPKHKATTPPTPKPSSVSTTFTLVHAHRLPAIAKLVTSRTSADQYHSTNSLSLDLGALLAKLSINQPTMSDYVNNDMQTALFEDDLANVDWAKLQEEVMSEPWLQFDDFNWSAWDQGVEDQAPVPEDGWALGLCIAIPGVESCTPKISDDSQVVMSPSPTSPTPRPSLSDVGHYEPSKLNKPYICDVHGCKSRPFKRRGDLNRHLQTHTSQQRYDCPAQGCNRRGARGFIRNDKLNDHMLAGHDDNDIFICPNARCGQQFPRDLFSIHSECHPYDLLCNYRTCPLPRCSFKVHWKKLDNLQNHLQNTHDPKGRAKFANVLLRRGYDFPSCKIVCPVCPDGPKFTSHGEFSGHFEQVHFLGPFCGVHNPCQTKTCFGRSMRWRRNAPAFILDGVRHHRQTILSLLPEFKNSLVLKDIRCKQW